MTDIKIDLVDSVTQSEIQDTITYAERTIAANGITLTEGEKQGIEALREQIELHRDISKATFRLDAEDADNAHAGILKGLPEGSDDVVSDRFYNTVFGVAAATTALNSLFDKARPVGYDLKVTLADYVSVPYRNRTRTYYLGVTEDGEKVAIQTEMWDDFMSRLGSETCRKYQPVINLVDCAEEPRAYPYWVGLPDCIEHRKVYCLEMRFADPRQQGAYERFRKAARMSDCFYDILAGGDRLTNHIDGEIADMDARIAELTALRDSIKG